MNELNELKRLSFFTGFFTTAEDWNQGQKYHLEKCKLHSRGLHTPGIIQGEGQELWVKATDPASLYVEVLAGAALDGEGNAIYLGQPRKLEVVPPDTLPQLVYIAIKYAEEPTDYVENVETPQYSGYSRMAEVPRLEVTTTKPDKQAWLELARIDLQPGVTEIADPKDPNNPKGDEINRRHVVWAGSVGVAEEQMSPETLQHLIQVMRRTRRDFAALADRFPVPSANDVRHAALTVETLARTRCLRPGQLPDVLAAIAAIEQDVGQEIGEKYGNVVDTTAEFHEYQTAVQNLQAALRLREELGILTAQDAVAEAARELSEVAIESPIADAGRDQTVTVLEDEATVTLDATGSRARGGREIIRYLWVRRE